MHAAQGRKHRRKTSLDRKFVGDYVNAGAARRSVPNPALGNLFWPGQSSMELFLFQIRLIFILRIRL
jgi:hypothetical protein